MDYFKELYEYVSNNCEIQEHDQQLCDIKVPDVVGFSINEETKYVYQHYSKFELGWYKDNKYKGSVSFVPYSRLNGEHKDFVDLMEDVYDCNEDELGISEDIHNWYPVFNFPNGDAFCLDKRTGAIVLWAHDSLEGDLCMHGIKVANSIDDLFKKWSEIQFTDIYYWDEVVNEDGIDLESEKLKKYMA
jgi:hypothetical protein